MDTTNTASPCTTAARSDSTSSPEFEFWMLRNPSFPQPNLHSADELFVDGVLLPLHLLPSTSKPDPPPDPDQLAASPDPDPEPASSSPAIITESSTSATTTLSTSKRWKDIFKKKNTENNDTEEKEKGKKKKKEIKKTGSGAGSAAELNINIWPFSRSRSAGNAVTRPKFLSGAPSSTRKVNSAPCSRSNSTGDSKSRKWPSSPGRPGVHVGRTSPVWQVRRTKNSNNTAAQVLAQNNDGAEAKKRESATCHRRGTKARVLNLNVPMCIGYRQHLSCRCDENGGAVSGTTSVRGGDNNDGGGCSGGEGSNNDGGSGVNLFNLRNLFNKKSIVTSH